jgi:hypothetical protein
MTNSKWMEICENVSRKELAAHARMHQEKKAKKLYEKMYPTKKHGATPGKKGGKGGKAPKGKLASNASLPRFTRELAETSGRSERGIQDDLKI